jgi:primosomal protein N' (replication factor Y)
MKYLEVAIAAPLHHSLSYLPPVDTTIPLVPGLRLLVPLAGRLLTGYLLGEQGADQIECDAGKLRPVADVLDDAPLFPEQSVAFFRWIADYYHYPIGMVIQGGLPAGLTVKSRRRIMLTENGRQHFSRSETRDGEQDPAWLALLVRDGMLPPAETGRLLRTSARNTLEQWQRRGLIDIGRSVTRPGVKPKTATFIMMTESGHLSGEEGSIAAALKPSAQKTLGILQELIDEQNGAPLQAVEQGQLTRRYRGAGRALKELAARRLIATEKRRVYRDPFGGVTPYLAPIKSLSAEQEECLHQLLPAVAARRFAPFLLHGVTGSGKTEIYLRAAAAALEAGRSVLVLVPEIALATQLEACFLSRFGDQVAILHSGLAVGEFYDQWQRIMQKQARVVIGARSAVFAPLADPGLIVVDEEHDASYKQEDGLRYQARDLAILRASMHKSVVVLGSATPSVASRYNAAKGKFKLLVLRNRIENRPLPQVTIVDLRSIATVSGRPPLFTPQLIAALKENLKKGYQSLVFLNRRGYANMMLCCGCGRNLLCRNCQVTLTLHKERRQLLCHYCGYAVPSAIICPECGSSKIIQVGFGTERIEHELAALLPSARLARLDRDTCTRRADFLGVFKAMRDHEVDILIGTQMIAKGHHFPKVTLVGIIWADAGLGMPDFRGAERTFQLLSQVTGRAGRGDAPGRVIIQTHQPQHYAVVHACRHDYEALYQQELELRRELNYPPFTRIINFRIEGDEEEEVRDIAQRLARQATSAGRRFGLRVLGPAPAPLMRLRGKFRWQVLLMGREHRKLHTVTDSLLQSYAGPAKRGKKVKVSVDIDPENLL